MATAHIKKIIKVSGSLAIILPKQWAKGKVKPGEEMVVVSDGEAIDDNSGHGLVNEYRNINSTLGSKLRRASHSEKGGAETMWMNVHRLLALLRQRGIDPRDVTVFVDDHVINPRYRRPIPDESTFEEDEDTSEDEPDEY